MKIRPMMEGRLKQKKISSFKYIIGGLKSMNSRFVLLKLKEYEHVLNKTETYVSTNQYYQKHDCQNFRAIHIFLF
jgi:hypothetical protein